MGRALCAPGAAIGGHSLSTQPRGPLRAPAVGPAAQRRRGAPRQPAAAADGDSAAPAAPAAPRAAALLLEVDGALTDVVMAGHREAFNRAFRDLGLECTNWTAPLYNDLLTRSDGTGEGLVAAYYGTLGSWPLSVGKGEEPVFARKVHELKQQHFGRMLRGGQLPLRSDAQRVMRDALADGAAVALLAETASAPGEDVVGACMAQLDADLAPQLRVYSAGLHRAPEEGEGEEEGEGAEPGAGFRAAAARLQQGAAESFVQQLSRDAPQSAARVRLGASLLNPGAPRVSPEWLAAVAATLGVPAARCIVVGSSGALVSAAAAAGMVAVALPRQAALAASYPDAAAKFEGWGPGYATWPRLAGLARGAAGR